MDTSIAIIRLLEICATDRENMGGRSTSTLVAIRNCICLDRSSICTEEKLFLTFHTTLSIYVTQGSSVHGPIQHGKSVHTEGDIDTDI